MKIDFKIINDLMLIHYEIALAVLLGICFLLYYISRRYILHLVGKLTNRIPSETIKALFTPRLLAELSLLMPFFIFNLGLRAIEGMPELIGIGLKRATLAALVILTIQCISVLLWNFNAVYSKLEIARNRPIKGIIQIFIILLYGIGLILLISVVLDKSPAIFLSGLGAMTAVLLLIFRDTILSLVAGVQLTTNELIKVGDWIEMPQFNADGDVIDIALHSVKVQNWDRTITSIPTHKFLENSFKNWRGMKESGGRRVKRSMLIDVNSIRFLNEDEITKFKNFVLLKDYIETKESELRDYNAQFDPHLKVNSRRLTNIGTFRAYVGQYLARHPKVKKDMTMMVRQLAPSEHGLPIEIYVFLNDIRWAHYEAAQSDIFDHLFAIIPEFGLRVHQSPTGYDFRHWQVNN